MSLFKVGIRRSRLPDASTPQDYETRVLALNPDLYLPNGRTKHASAPGATGTAVNSPQTGVTSLAQDDPSGSSTGFSGETTTAPHVTIPSPLSGANVTIDMIVQLDDITKAKHVLAAHGGGAEVAGQLSIEVVTGGATRCWSADTANTPRVFMSATGAIQQGTAHKITYQRQSNVAGWSQRVYVDGVLVAEDATQRTWGSFTAGTFYLGTWLQDGSHAGPTDGLIAHVAGWNSLLTPTQIQSLVHTQSVAWAEDIDAGSVQAGSSITVNLFARGAHGKLPIVIAANDSAGGRALTAESGSEITITGTGTTDALDQSFPYLFLDAEGKSSGSKTVTIDVLAAPVVGGDVALPSALTAFQPSRFKVTTLTNWPAGRTPKDVVTQGTHAHGYVRRTWKATDNDGTYMDFQAGWRKTASADVIKIRLDNNAELDLSYTVNHTIPTATVNLDRSGQTGGAHTSWTSAIAAAGTNGVVVVRARSGSTGGLLNSVYPIDLQVGGGVGGANGVRVVAHPDDLAAGRRPRIHMQGTTLARYCDELNAGHWVVDTALGGAHGNVWRTTQVVGSLANIGCSYRTKSGGLRRCFTYTNTSGTPGALARLRDTTYPRVHVNNPDTPSEWDLYMGPGIYLHSDGRLYIRLSALRAGVGAQQVNASAGVGPNPPWDWSDDDPESEDPNQCQLYISSSGNTTSQANPSTGINYILRLDGRNSWTLENLDLVSGGDTIEMDGTTGHTLRGCRLLGWAPPNMDDSTTQSTARRSHHVFQAENAFDILCDSCEFWGAACPWVGWDENKGRHGAYSWPQKALLWWMQVDTSGGVDRCSFKFVNCLIDGFLTPTRPSGRNSYAKFHQCSLRYWGMDGSFVCEPPSDRIEYLRTQFFEGTYTGWANSPAWLPNNRMFIGYCLVCNFRPYMHQNGYWAIDEDTFEANQFVCGSGEVAHESNRKQISRWFMYNNTCIGSHNHRDTEYSRNTGGSLSFAPGGAGACVHPPSWNRMMREWWSRNNIAVVRPNGSLGQNAGGFGGGGDSHVAILGHQNNIGYQTTREGYSCDYNIYHRGSGMPSVGNSGVITTVGSSGGLNSRNSITDVRSDTGQEANGSITDPQFLGSWDAGELDRVLHTNAFWCLQAGSPAASGGDTTDRSWPDVDFGAEISYGGNTWRGCMDPLASAVEQQVGPLCPLPSGL